MIELSNHMEYEIESCEKCDHDMINVDANEVTRADLIMLRNKGIHISNPDTEDLICLNCHISHFNSWYEDKKDDEDDSYHTPFTSSFGSIGGTFGGFGGFSGGSFSGGGASHSW